MELRVSVTKYSSRYLDYFVFGFNSRCLADSEVALDLPKLGCSASVYGDIAHSLMTPIE